MVKYHFITYCTEDHKMFADYNAHTATNVGMFDTTQIYTPNDLDERFKIYNNHILNLKKGAGYWIWKPYVILKKLLELDEGDILCYNDSKYIWLTDIRNLTTEVLSDKDIGIYYNRPSANINFEKNWTKFDTYVIMNIDNNVFNSMYQSPQIWAGFILLRKNFNTIRFISEWLTYVQDNRLSTDSKSIFSNEFDDFREHRHDQSILSILSKKWNNKIHHFNQNHLLDMRNPTEISLIPPLLREKLTITSGAHLRNSFNSVLSR